MIQKITQNNGNFWTVNLIMRAKIVNQSSDFPVRRTGSYRHKKEHVTDDDDSFTVSSRVFTLVSFHFPISEVWEWNTQQLPRSSIGRWFQLITMSHSIDRWKVFSPRLHIAVVFMINTQNVHDGSFDPGISCTVVTLRRLRSQWCVILALYM